MANLQQDGAFNPTSSWGANVKVAAPGTDIFSTYIGSTTATEVFFGTSMASPHVAGIATLLFNAFPGATQAQVRSLRHETIARSRGGGDAPQCACPRRKA